MRTIWGSHSYWWSWRPRLRPEAPASQRADLRWWWQASQPKTGSGGPEWLGKVKCRGDMQTGRILYVFSPPPWMGTLWDSSPPDSSMFWFLSSSCADRVTYIENHHSHKNCLYIFHLTRWKKWLVVVRRRWWCGRKIKSCYEPRICPSNKFVPAE